MVADKSHRLKGKVGVHDLQYRWLNLVYLTSNLNGDRLREGLPCGWVTRVDHAHIQSALEELLAEQTSYPSIDVHDEFIVEHVSASSTPEILYGSVNGPAPLDCRVMSMALFSRAINNWLGCSLTAFAPWRPEQRPVYSGHVYPVRLAPSRGP